MDFQDLMYFGHSKNNMDEYCKGIREAFPNVRLEEAHDIIKGYRQEVFLLETQINDYYAWSIAHGWGESSLNLMLIATGDDNIDEVKRYVKLAKQQYPHKFKTK